MKGSIMPRCTYKMKRSFIKSLTMHMPAAPDHFSRCSAINGQGPRLMKDLPALIPCPLPDFAMQYSREILSCSIHAPMNLCGLHVPGSCHIDSGETLHLCRLDHSPDRDILLVAADRNRHMKHPVVETRGT